MVEEGAVSLSQRACPRLPDEDDVEEEKAIDLETFYEDFIRPGRGKSTVIAEMENRAAQARLQPLLKAIEQNRHEEAPRARR